jgi:proline iminopeptidase
MLRTADGCTLWTKVSGSGPPIVLVHGGPGWWDTLDDLAVLIADLGTVHQWDQRGAGRSDRRGPYTIARFVADLDAVRHQTGHARITLVGHSWGAGLALQYCLAHPDRVDRLIYVSGVGLDGTPASYQQKVDEILAREQYDDPWLARLSTGFADRSTAYENVRRLNTPRFSVNAECAAALTAEVRAWSDRVAACRALAVPTLIVHGELDLRPPSVTDSLLDALPDASREIIAGAAHYPWLEAPQGFAAVVRPFLAAHARPRAHLPVPRPLEAQSPDWVIGVPSGGTTSAQEYRGERGSPRAHQPTRQPDTWSPLMAKNKGGREVRKPKQPKQAKSNPSDSAIVPPTKQGRK